MYPEFPLFSMEHTCVFILETVAAPPHPINDVEWTKNGGSLGCVFVMFAGINDQDQGQLVEEGFYFGSWFQRDESPS